MKEPDDVSAMLRLKALGWGRGGSRRSWGCSRTTVRRWLREGGWRCPVAPTRKTSLDGLGGWLSERFRRHAATRTWFARSSRPRGALR